MNNYNHCPPEYRKYCAIPVSELDNINWDDLLCYDNQPHRYNNTNPAVQSEATKFMVKYDGREPKPYCLYGYTAYTYEEAKAIVSDPESPWYQQDII